MVQLANPVPDPDIEISGGPGHPDPKIRGGGEACLPKEFFWPFGPQFGPKIRGGGVGPSPGFATVIRLKGKFKKHCW